MSTFSAVPVEITSPSGTSVQVHGGDSFTLRCKGHATSRLAWYVDGVLITLLPRRFDVSLDENPESGSKVSLLRKDDVTSNDTGTYTCRDVSTDDDGDSILVLVDHNREFRVIFEEFDALSVGYTRGVRRGILGMTPVLGEYKRART